MQPLIQYWGNKQASREPRLKTIRPQSTLGTPPDLGFPASHVCDIQRMGPQSFTSFPAHHFFSRVYRPMTVSAFG